MNTHLSEDQFATCLLGQCTDTEIQHIRECRECSGELSRLRDTIASFRSAVRDRVEKRVTSSPDISPLPLRGATTFVVVPKWGWALLATAALVVTMVPSRTKRTEQPVSVESGGTASDPDALMRAVNLHLSRTMPAAMEPVLALLPEESSIPKSGGVQ